MNSLRGSLLVASPHMHDPNFMQTVVLLVEHTAEGALGLVLNRPMALTLAELWEKLEQEVLTADPSPVYCGGPVSGPVMALHTQPEIADETILPGVYLASDGDKLRQLIRGGQPPLQVYVGYSGWAGGQLESELHQDGWLTIPGSADRVFAADCDALWHACVRQSGQHFLQHTLGIRQFPTDPHAN